MASPTTTPDVGRRETGSNLSTVPYLPGLDGMRALAVVAVMVYHANSEWLPGGFLGVEVFFVISGYLITLLLMSEHERTGRIDVIQFWIRRARRLLPALFLMMFLLVTYTAIFRPDTLGRLRGDVLAGVFYVSNWFQIWVGAGYSASGDFAPLRHLWSLAVEEQFYLVWPLVMVLLLRRHRSRSLARTAQWLALAAVGVAVLTALLYHSGRIAECSVTPEAYWTMGERCISKTDTIYLSTITRSTGILLGAAFAMLWRPMAIMRGPLRDRNALLDLLGVLAIGALYAACSWMYFISPSGADGVLFRGGFLFTDLATLVVIAAVTHQRSRLGRVLGNPVFLWIGTRSYGLYLYHWPIYQIIREVAGNSLTFPEFVAAMVATAIITELSYVYVETPIRRGEVGPWLNRVWRQRDPVPRQVLGVSALVCLLLGSFGVVQIANADVEPNQIELAMVEGERSVVSADELLDGSAGQNAAVRQPATTTTVPSATTTIPSTTTTTTTPPTTSTAPPTTPAPVVVTAAPATSAPTAPPTTPAPTTPAPTTPAPTTPAPTPAPTAPPATAPPTSAPAIPAEGATRVSHLAIGDSVMLGAAGSLVDHGWVVNAESSRQMIDTIPMMQQLGANGVFGDVVVVHLGTNGPISNNTLDGFLAPMAGVSTVVLLTVEADRSYTAGNNDKIRSRHGQGNVVVLDWAAEAGNCPGACFEADGIHLKAAGRHYYADLVAQVTGR